MRGARAANRPTSLGATVLIVERTSSQLYSRQNQKSPWHFAVARKLRIRLTATDRTRAEEGDT